MQTDRTKEEHIALTQTAYSVTDAKATVLTLVDRMKERAFNRELTDTEWTVIGIHMMKAWREGWAQGVVGRYRTDRSNDAS